MGPEGLVDPAKSVELAPSAVQLITRVERRSASGHLLQDAMFPPTRLSTPPKRTNSVAKKTIYSVEVASAACRFGRELALEPVDSEISGSSQPGNRPRYLAVSSRDIQLNSPQSPTKRRTPHRITSRCKEAGNSLLPQQQLPWALVASRYPLRTRRR